YAVKKSFSSILFSNPYIDKVHLLQDNISALITELRNEQFDYVIDLHQNFRSNRIKSRMKIPAFSYEKLNFQKFLLVHLKINRLPEKHIVERYLEAISVFDVVNDNKGLDFFIPCAEGFNQQELPENFQKGYVAFVIAGTFFTKKLPVEKVTEICNRIEFPVILIGGKNEFSEGEQIVSASGGNILNFAGKLSLNQSASLVRDSNIVLTNDTGLMHIAAAFKKKILSFWGNTVPEFGMVPYLPHPASKIMENNNLKCRPCSKLGYQKCPKNHFKCMYELYVDEVVGWVKTNF
ncbi:MAG: lipopolysaccharide heptosyltransferase family protein, partial [Bacteroidia bacterium]|nr:lipopolysaccharide heptosyltransferase family protein [Bacteroidia bacterium]